MPMLPTDSIFFATGLNHKKNDGIGLCQESFKLIFNQFSGNYAQQNICTAFFLLQILLKRLQP